MSQELPGMVSVALGCVLVLLGRWGSRNLDDLVPITVAAQRREKELRSLRRGSRSCLLLGGLFCIAGTALVVSGAHP